MEKRIDLEKRGRNPSQITDLNLDNCRATQICGLTDEFVNLKNLSLINVGLMSLKGFPTLPNLERLELSDNRIQSGLNLLSGSSKLVNLNLSGNKIKDLEALDPLKDFKHLESLDLFNCEVTNVPNYRNEVFKLLPALKWLDGYDKNGKELPDSDDEEDGDGENDVDDEDEEEDGEDACEPDEDEEEEEDDSDDEVGLSYIQGDEVDEEDSGDEFNPNPNELENSGDEDIDDDADEDEADSSAVSAGTSNKNDMGAVEESANSASRGQKRKREDEDGDDGGV